MLIQPDTYVRLIKNCPLDKSYQHTLYFKGAGNASATAAVAEGKAHQEAYFKSLDGVTLTKQSYQRHSKNTLTVTTKIEEIYNYNYLMFKNTSFENKWFYAFITNVEYVNNNTSRIEYEIDVVQTWLFDFNLKECFVEREHSLFDDIGFNKVEEDINIGSYVYSPRSYYWDDPLNGYQDKYLFMRNSPIQFMHTMTIVAMLNPGILTPDEAEGFSEFTLDKGLYSGVYQGVNFICIPLNPNNVSLLHDLFNGLNVLTGGGITAVFLMPSMFVPDPSGSSDIYQRYNTVYTAKVLPPTKIGNYTPNNKKLLTYPYSCGYLTNHRGEYVDIMFEYCDKNDDGAVEFCLTGNFGTNPSVMAYPKNYLGVEDNVEHCVTIPQYPLCTWGTTGFTEWASNNLTSGLVSAVGSLAKAGAHQYVPRTSKKAAPISTIREANLVNTGVGSAVDYIVGGVSSVFQGGNTYGSGNTDLMFGVEKGTEINVYYKQITQEYAVLIDSYFDKFGYACKAVKYPNISNRPRWNYVKTVGCYITGNLPSNDKDKICSIFDNGITFWKDHNYVGVYTNDNSPEAESAYPY